MLEQKETRWQQEWEDFSHILNKQEKQLKKEKNYFDQIYKEVANVLENVNKKLQCLETKSVHEKEKLS